MKLPSLKTHHLVFRIESINGLGCYRNVDMTYLDLEKRECSMSSSLVYELFGHTGNTATHPSPEYDHELQKNMRNEFVYSVDNHLFGFNNLSQVKSWFGARIKRMHTFMHDIHRFRLHAYLVPKHQEKVLMKGKYQCIFSRKSSFHVGSFETNDGLPSLSDIRSEIECRLARIEEWDDTPYSEHGLCHPDYLSDYDIPNEMGLLRRHLIQIGRVNNMA